MALLSSTNFLGRNLLSLLQREDVIYGLGGRIRTYHICMYIHTYAYDACIHTYVCINFYTIYTRHDFKPLKHKDQFAKIYDVIITSKQNLKVQMESGWKIKNIFVRSLQGGGAWVSSLGIQKNVLCKFAMWLYGEDGIGGLGMT